MSILYLCDRRACEHCGPDCNATPDIFHARNFRKSPYADDTYIEQAHPLVILKCNIMLKPEQKKQLYNDALREMNNGVILVDPRLEPIVLDDGKTYICTITLGEEGETK